MLNPTNFSFSEACEYLSLSPNDFTMLREQGFIVTQDEAGKQVYPKLVLDLVLALLKLEAERGWSRATIAWYADLAFVTEVGHSILLPIPSVNHPSSELLSNWLMTPYVQIVLDDLQTNIEDEEGTFVALLRSLVAVGEERLWADTQILEQFALYPIITYFEEKGVPIRQQKQSVARDAGHIMLSLVLVFTTVAPPISQELLSMFSQFEARFVAPISTKDILKEQALIQREGLVAVDKLYASKAVEIHSPSDAWGFRLGVVSSRRRTITLRMKVAPDSTEAMLDNIIDLIRPFIGAYGARVIHLLYQIANDPPHWRSPIITISTNELLDKLGVKRDVRGIHRIQNRKRLRDVLNVAHELEIIGEFTAWQDGQPITRAFYKTVLSLIGADFDPVEREGISTSELRLKGLPKTVQIRLNFYDGVRRLDGTLGNQYALMPRLGEPASLTNASRVGSDELLKSYLFYRFRQMRMASPTLTFTRAIALEKAGITNKNSRQATATLRKALDKLVTSNVIESYSSEFPTKPSEILEITLSEDSVRLFRR